MDPDSGTGTIENTIQSRNADVEASVIRTNQVVINSEVLPTLPKPGYGNAPPVVSNQGETAPYAAASFSSKSPYSGSLHGSNSVNDPGIGLSTNPEGHGVRSITPEPALPDPEGNGVQSVAPAPEPVFPVPEGNGVQTVAPEPVLLDPEGNGVQSVTPEPVSTLDIPAEASAWSMVSASPRSGPGYLIHDSMFTEDVDWRNPDRTSVSSNPTQTMVHEEGYDPNRIPSSVFSSKPSSQIDWSSASNESLFSIYMGNSFSGYQGIFKSGEFGMIEGMYTPQNPFESFEAKANEGSNFSPKLPTLQETSHETSHEQEIQPSANIKDDITIQKGPSNSSNEYKVYLEESMAPSSISAPKGGASPFEGTSSIQNRLSNDSAKNRLSNESSKSSGSKNRLSDESVRSGGSFAFPVLVNDVSKASSFSVKLEKKQEPKTKHRPEPPEPATTQAPPRGRGCLSCLPGWLRCC